MFDLFATLKRTAAVIAGIAGPLLLSVHPAHAEPAASWPTPPITLIMGFPAGAGVELD